MVPLITIKRIFTWLCMYPADESSSKWNKIAYILFVSAVVSVNLCCLVFYLIFFFGCLSIDLDAALFALSCVAAFCGVTYVCMTAIPKRHKIEAMFSTLETIYNDSKSSMFFSFSYGFNL